MMNVLAQSNRVIFQEFVSSNVLLAFDYDGTLAPIVSDPNRARMRTRSRDLLSELGKRYPVVVISGRAQSDVLKKLRGAGVREVIGNHGMEPWHASSRYIAEVERWLPVLNAAVAAFKGVVIEDKGYSIAIHYRLSREKKEARAAILKAAAGLGDVRVVGGKQVVNILPHGAPHKASRSSARGSACSAIQLSTWGMMKPTKMCLHSTSRGGCSASVSARSATRRPRTISPIRLPSTNSWQHLSSVVAVQLEVRGQHGEP